MEGRVTQVGASGPLLIEWSPTMVELFDAASNRHTKGASIAECVDAADAGRSVVIGVSRRSAYIRTLYAPRASATEVRHVLGLQLASLIPLAPGEFTFGYRLGEEVAGKGRTAVVGAMRTDSLRKALEDAKFAGLRVRAVLPVACGSWLAAMSRSLANCAVVEQDGQAMGIDVIQDGELSYSRTIPTPRSPEELEDEVARTFAIVQAPTLPILSNGCEGLIAEVSSERQSVSFLSDLASIDKLLFSFELPEKLERLQASAIRSRAARAMVAAAGAVCLGSYALIARYSHESMAARDSDRKLKAVTKARLKLSQVQANLTRTQRAAHILDVAFRPSQQLSDVITVLSGSASKDSWFTSLSVGRGLPATVSGLALKDGDVAKLVADLSEDPRFQEMKVVSTAKATVGKKQITQFVISGKPVGVVAFDRPPRGQKKA